jgi:hypothetical protein
MNSETRTCKKCNADFIIEPDDFGFYEKIQVPPPTFCPECRYVRRLLWRNERNYYRRSCDLCKKNIIAVYPADVLFPVYCVKCWWGEGWDPYSYGRDFDFSRPFFEQYKDLQNTVPALSMMNDDGIASINCEYTYDWAFSKNVYMCVCGWHVENAFHSFWIDYSKDVVDCWGTNNCELVCETVNCDRCYNCRFCTLCFDSNNCMLGHDLRGCTDCVMCVGLRSRRYCVRNKQYSKEEYEEKLKELNLGSRAALQKAKEEFQKLVLKIPRKYAYNIKTLNTTGDNLFEVKMSKNCFYGQGPVENCRYLVIIDKAKDTYDCNNTGNPELCYESVTPDNSRGNKFSIFCWKCAEAEYSNNCHSCQNVFGSTGLKHGSYSILNKRYSKEEYLVLHEKIVEHMKKTGEWGEFFPESLSPFAYNETAAIEWVPLMREEAVKHGYRWKEEEKKGYTPTKKAIEIPDTISEVSDDFVSEIIECEHKGICREKCTEAFRIASYELVLYKKMDIPLPTLCPNCRHYARLEKRNAPKLYKRLCQCAGVASQNEVYKNTVGHFHEDASCPNEFETSYPPERPEIVYCEPCYNNEIA